MGDSAALSWLALRCERLRLDTNTLKAAFRQLVVQPLVVLFFSSLPPQKARKLGAEQLQLVSLNPLWLRKENIKKICWILCAGLVFFASSAASSTQIAPKIHLRCPLGFITSFASSQVHWLLSGSKKKWAWCAESFLVANSSKSNLGFAVTPGTMGGKM